MSQLIGKIFNRMEIVEKLPSIRYDKYTRVMVRCKCKCGNFKVVELPHLQTNKIRSCGCLQKETARQTRINAVKINKETRDTENLSLPILTMKYILAVRNVSKVANKIGISSMSIRSMTNCESREVSLSPRLLNIVGEHFIRESEAVIESLCTPRTLDK